MVKIFRGRIPVLLLDQLIEKRNKKGLAMDSIGFRLELFRVHLGLKAQGMAAHLDISQGSYSDLQTDNSEPSCNTIKNILNLEGTTVDVRWLLLGNE